MEAWNPVLIKVISLQFDSAFGGFKDDELREFLKDKDLISSHDYFFVRKYPVSRFYP